jgi:hypothetical protein
VDSYCCLGSCAGGSLDCYSCGLSGTEGTCTEIPACAEIDAVTVSLDYTLGPQVTHIAECNEGNNWSATAEGAGACLPLTRTYYEPFTVSRVFQAVCPTGTSPTWLNFGYTLGRPAGETDTTAKVEFRFQAFDENASGTCDAQTSVIASPPTPVGTADWTGTQQPPVCPLDGSVTGCPLDLGTYLKAKFPYGSKAACIQMDAYGIPTDGTTPRLINWQVTYQCVAGQ